MDFKGKQIAIDMYNCLEEIISDNKKVEELLQKAAEVYKIGAYSVCYNIDENGEYSFSVPCKRGHMNLHVYPALGFAAIDIFTCKDDAEPENLAAFLKKTFSPDKSKITFLQRGDFGSQSDMKPRRRSQIKTMHRAKSAGNQLLKIVMKPKSD
ncbi:MAG: S-adenosylmethionine decarboxylase-like protein [Acholeplasmataceae bacterium]|nr:S-adenosylmethionine decarboxylase [Acidaminococcaceae bacterium]NLY84163.1 S-adenosylmethionine decarboxylase-like protein [Acholeplasmataceae bacterium]